jgi:L-amino acid N-acyltransferase YncA
MQTSDENEHDMDVRKQARERLSMWRASYNAVERLVAEVQDKVHWSLGFANCGRSRISGEFEGRWMLLR